MIDHKGYIKGRLDTLKTDYITTLTNIERVEKDLNEAKSASLEILGAIKNLELMLEYFIKLESLEPKPEVKKEESLRTPKKESKTKNK